MEIDSFVQSIPCCSKSIMRRNPTAPKNTQKIPIVSARTCERINIWPILTRSPSPASQTQSPMRRKRRFFVIHQPQPHFGYRSQTPSHTPLQPSPLPPLASNLDLTQCRKQTNPSLSPACEFARAPCLHPARKCICSTPSGAATSELAPFGDWAKARLRSESLGLGIGAEAAWMGVRWGLTWLWALRVCGVRRRDAWWWFVVCQMGSV